MGWLNQQPGPVWGTGAGHPGTSWARRAACWRGALAALRKGPCATWNRSNGGESTGQTWLAPCRATLSLPDGTRTEPHTWASPALRQEGKLRPGAQGRWALPPPGQGLSAPYL